MQLNKYNVRILRNIKNNNYNIQLHLNCIKSSSSHHMRFIVWPPTVSPGKILYLEWMDGIEMIQRNILTAVELSNDELLSQIALNTLDYFITINNTYKQSYIQFKINEEKIDEILAPLAKNPISNTFRTN